MCVCVCLSLSPPPHRAPPPNDQLTAAAWELSVARCVLGPAVNPRGARSHSLHDGGGALLDSLTLRTLARTHSPIFSSAGLPPSH